MKEHYFFTIKKGGGVDGENNGFMGKRCEFKNKNISITNLFQ